MDTRGRCLLGRRCRSYVPCAHGAESVERVCSSRMPPFSWLSTDVLSMCLFLFQKVSVQLESARFSKSQEMCTTTRQLLMLKLCMPQLKLVQKKYFFFTLQALNSYIVFLVFLHNNKKRCIGNNNNSNNCYNG